MAQKKKPKKKKKKKKRRIIIGRREKIDIPTLDLQGIDAKIDTGAYTSSLHCTNIQCIEYDGQEYVEFNILDPTHPQYHHKRFRLPNYRYKQIKNSFGETERRYVITLEIILFQQSIETEFTLTNRGAMKFPILLGRKLLMSRFLVDVNRYNLSHKKKKITIKQ